MKAKLFFLGIAALAFSTISPTIYAQTASAKIDKPLSYSQVVKLIGLGEDAKISKALNGKFVKLTLLAAGPQSLVVKRGDGVFFVCETRVAGFKKGPVIAKIIKIETTHEGDISLSLDRCGI